ncbi:MAG TPA: thiamine pyrophosphate-binding protein [Egibacteraceae bacterium]|nr:thiamine pyrophosphate-binding protein [Egibacteraceae bacterium]
MSDVIARYLVSQGVQRVYGLVGGHIQPMWDAVALAGIDIVDVRHEGAAVYMAHADAEISGQLAVAMVTAGPGLTNAVTAIANAHTSRVPVLVMSGRTPRPQVGMGAMQDVPQAAVVGPLCRRVEMVSERHHVLSRLEAVVEAARGGDEPAGPAYIDFPTDLLVEQVQPADVDEQAFRGPRPRASVQPAQADIDRAAALLAGAQRPVLISGRGAVGAREELEAFLAATGALYLDTGESRGILEPTHPAYVPAMRSRVMKEADLVVTAGRRLDFQLAYGSSAVFAADPAFLRIGRTADEVGGNRRADVELRADVSSALDALTAAVFGTPEPDATWLEEIREQNRARSEKLQRMLVDQSEGDDGRIHPYQLIRVLNEQIDDDAVVVADGGDILSFARVALKAPTYLDCGALGCLGVGVPFATSAAINHPDRQVVALIGDGSFGFTAIDVDTAVRQGAKAVFVIANNEAWNIERYDQVERFDGRLVGVELPGCSYELVGRGLGAHAERVERFEDLAPAFARALENAPAVLEVMVTRDARSPDFASGLAIVPPRQALLAWNDAEQSLRA